MLPHPGCHGACQRGNAPGYPGRGNLSRADPWNCRAGSARMTLFFTLGVIAALLTFFFSPIFFKVGLKFRLYPEIRERDVHSRPTPRLGGVAMFAGILVAVGAAAFVATLGSER